MPLRKIYAQLSCSDINAGGEWYRKLFGRPSDLDPMEGLKEWHHGQSAGFQLVLNPAAAGQGAITLIVENLADERDCLRSAGLDAGEVFTGDFAAFFQISDPDGNTITLAEPSGERVTP